MFNHNKARTTCLLLGINWVLFLVSTQLSTDGSLIYVDISLEEIVNVKHLHRDIRGEIHVIMKQQKLQRKCMWLYSHHWACRQNGHYGDVVMGVIAPQITSLTIVYSTVYSDADQRKHQSSASLAFVRGIHRGPVNSPHKWPVTRKMFPFDDVIMWCSDSVYTQDWNSEGENMFNCTSEIHDDVFLKDLSLILSFN